MRKLTLIAAISLLGCAAAPRPEFTPTGTSANVATVYIYRLPNHAKAVRSPDVYVGGERLFTLQDGGYGVVILPPGTYTFAVRNPCLPAVTYDLAAHGGEEIFLRLSMPAGSRADQACRLSPHLDAVEKSVAPTELFYTKLAKGASREGRMPESLGK